MNDEVLIRFDKVSKRFGDFPVLRELDFEVRRGEKVTIIGPSGSGKSTVLRVLMTLEPIDEGVVFVDGEPLWHEKRGGMLAPAGEAHLRRMRQKMGMVFQQFNLFPHMTVMRNLTEAPVRVLGLSRREARQRAGALLETVGLSDQADKFPPQLSGGQQQRVGIARALAMRPQIMLFDEPTSALDPELVGDVLKVIHRLSDEHDLTMILVTHQMDFAQRISDRICFFDQGAVCEQGPPEQIFSAPRHPRTQDFLRAVLHPDD
ncbi:ectoine/hydroxyectoine ABC transporter ATP-binding protein EhuA [Chromobacterium paludis]|uniref:Ectoine/hydroxyectoine ABC transporter ATP-binding protein EhuA n=1 Tax=Chromobacterium paludis TaxID=2605945 RepID=A0A5C1DIN7_9NEIS|nr:ectoine/hydroxyectoine ABC transporter ATP-binding protein EhuA [Chromobacterium paludis]